MTNIKFFFITLCSFYLFKKLLKIQTGLPERSLDCAISLALTAVMAFFRHYIGAGGIFASAVLFCMICRFYFQQPTTVSFVTGIVAYGLSYIALYGAVVILLPITFLCAWLPIPGEYIEYVALFLAGLVQLLLVKIPFRSGRLVNGMPYLREGHAGWFGAVISLILLLASSLLFAHPGEDVRILLYLILAAESGFVLFVWWNGKILFRYFEKIKDRRIEQLHMEVQ